MRPTVLLFDIDGTLISTGGAARRALEEALAELFDVPEWTADFSFGGMTDRGIMRRAFEAMDRAVDELAIDAAIDHYIARLDRSLDAAPPYDANAGVNDVLAELHGRPGYAVGLGTGNVERGARAKLERVGLNRHFAFGGFGCDAEARPELILRGAERGAERLDVPLGRCRVLIIGDTPKDVHAAHENGFECVAVATGGVSAEELAKTDAEWFFASLDDPEARSAILFGRPG